MFCRYCGAPLPDGAKFCSTCGKPVSSQAARPSAPKQTPQNPQVPQKPEQNSPYPDRPMQNPPYPDRPMQDSPYPDRPMQNSPYPDRPMQNSPYPDRPMQDSPYPDRSAQNSSQKNLGEIVTPVLNSAAGKIHNLLGGLTQNLGKSRPKAQPQAQKGPRVKVKKSFNIGNFICWTGCALAAVSLFLPYVSVSLFGFSEDQALIDTDDGTIFLVIIVITAVVNLLRLNIGTIILSAFHFYFVYMEHDNIASSYASALSDFGMGHTLQFLGAILMLASSVAGLILWMKRKRSARI